MASGEPLRRPRRQRGFGYLMLLFAIAALGLGLASAGQVWHTTARREKEAQLLFIGQQFRLALAAYRDQSPVGTPTAPASLDDLLADRRFPVPRPHLRRLWRDPMTNDTDWVLVRQDGRIVAIRSRVDAQALRLVHAAPDAAFNGTNSYSEWVFTAAEPVAAATRIPENNTP